METKNNRKIDGILEANEFIKSIDSMAIFIKINALNALFLAIRSEEHLRGYIVVTDEFNRFTEELTRFVDKLRDLIHAIVVIISNELKINNRMVLYNKAAKFSSTGESRDIVQNFFEINERKIEDLDKQIEINLLEITRLLQKNERLILRGDMLAMQAKIEGAYAIKSRDVFRDVAENFQKHISDIRSSFQHLKKMLGKGLLYTGN